MKSLFYIVLFVGFLLGVSCTGKYSSTVPDPQPSVYYWRTVFQLGHEEMQFLKKHKIKKIYARYFDVKLSEKGKPVPVASMQWEQPVPQDIEMIPTVFVDWRALIDPNELASLIVRRVVQMSRTNDVPIRELQLDCDWTVSSRKIYYDFLKAVRRSLDSCGTFRLSATIRLHQFRQPPPPVDYGVLMCYNTGDLRDIHTRNAILDEQDVLPYLKELANYDLPLSAAYPLFGWKLLFEQHRMVAILPNADLSDTLLYRREARSQYRVIRSHTLSGALGRAVSVRTGALIKIDEVSFETIMRVKKYLENERPGLGGQIVLYSLNTNDINKYSYDEVEKIYSR